MNEAPVVKVSGLRFGYDRSPVLEDIDLVVRPGDFLAIIGPNGGGKTTLIKLMLGLLKPWAGRVDWAWAETPGRIGYVPQFSTFDRDFPLRVREVVMMGAVGRRGLFHRYNADDRRRTDEVLERLELAELAYEPVAELSGGQLQRALIGRALVCDPEILFLDEPTSSVDSRSRGLLNTLLRELNQRIPVVVVTHDITAFAGDVRQIACVNKRLFYHGGGTIDHEQLEAVYGCPVELVAHDVPHRVLDRHGH